MKIRLLSQLPLLKLGPTALIRVHSHASFSRAFQWCMNRPDRTKIGRRRYPENQVASPTKWKHRKTPQAPENRDFRDFQLRKPKMVLNVP